MRGTRIFLLLCSLLLIMPAAAVVAQDTDIPIYVRYCADVRAELGDDIFRAAMDEVEVQLQEVEATLTALDGGQLTYLEAIEASATAIDRWNETGKVDCMVAFNADVTNALNELLIAMLYGQIQALDPEISATHLGRARELIIVIRRQSQEAVDYLAQPVETAESSEAGEGLEPVDPDDTSEEPATLRTGDELNPIMEDFLLNNGVSVLVDAGIQVFPGDTLVVIQLNKYDDGSGRDYDFDNTMYTLDALSRLIADWPETAEISRISVETYNGTQRTLVVETTGQNFRDYYYAETITYEDFVNRMTVEFTATTE